MTFDDFCRHFGFQSHPFARAVPEAGLLHHRTFTEATTRLSLAIQSRTPALLTCEPGLGKSTLLGTLADGLDKSKAHLVYIGLSSCGPFGLMGQLAERYGARTKRSAAQTAQGVLDVLASSSRDEILIVDDAHRLPSVSLDELRLLSNLDFDRTPPFALLIVGQPALRDHLAQPELSSLWQRIAIRTSLTPLTDKETFEYLERRARAAGAKANLFRPAAAARIFEKTRGVPREINNVAMAALFAAAAASKRHVDLAEVEDAYFDQVNA